MDYQLNGLLRHYVLLLTLLVVKCRPTLPAPTPVDCNSVLGSTKRLAETVAYEATKLLEAYEALYGSTFGSIPAEVPSATVSGTSTSEKLQNIYTKEVLFHWHLSKVDEYQTEVWGKPESIQEPMKLTKTHLSNHFRKVEQLLKILHPESSLPTEAAPSQLPHNNDYAKKRYGWAVISNLKDLMKQVMQELEDLEAKGVCDKQTTASQSS